MAGQPSSQPQLGRRSYVDGHHAQQPINRIDVSSCDNLIDAKWVCKFKGVSARDIHVLNSRNGGAWM
eukprot:2357934-Amphidinium_carterae.2